MDLRDLVDPGHTALCVVECQNGVVGPDSSMRVLAEAVAAGGTVVVSSHELERVAALSPRVVTLAGGRIVDGSTGGGAA